MSNPNIPNITPTISLSLGQTVPLLLSSVALEELALAHLLNAEAEKLQFVLGTLTPASTAFAPATVSLTNLLDLDTSVQTTLRDVIKKEMLLEFKFENTLDLAGFLANLGTFTFTTPGIFTITVPEFATTARITAIGAAGGGNTATNGNGASLQGDFPVTPSQPLSILVGRQGGVGTPAIAGEGGGGGSFVWIGSGTGDLNFASLLIAAGGGGGAGGNNANGVNGVLTANAANGTGTGAGTGGVSAVGAGVATGGAAGGGGAGGGGGSLVVSGTPGLPAGTGGQNGSSIASGGAGGAGGTAGANAGGAGGLGGGAGAGAGAGANGGGGGGGGGFNGGGGGAAGGGGGGGGGSLNKGANQVNTAGVGTGDGVVIISFSGL